MSNGETQRPWHGDEVRAAVTELATMLKGLETLLNSKCALEAQVQDLQQQSKALVDQVAPQRAAAEEAAESIRTNLQRTEDLVRQQQVLEGRLQVIRDEIAGAHAAWDDEKRRDRQAHDQAMHRMAEEREQTQAALTALQEQLRAIHGTVGSLAQNS